MKRWVSTLLLLCAFVLSANYSAADAPRVLRGNKPTPLEEYRLAAAQKVKDNWSRQALLECNSRRGTSIAFTIMADGGIKDLEFHERSNCKQFDDLAHLAIIQAAPFSPFPIGLEVNQIKLGIQFAP
jgi:outer membrane biosynthesis protein TonB